MKSITELAEWQALQQHCLVIEKEHIRDWFLQNEHRSSQFSASALGITIDYSRNRIQDTTLLKLIQLAKKCELKEQLHAIYQGETINRSENRPALHMRLRDKDTSPFLVMNSNINDHIQKTSKDLRAFVEALHDYPFTDIITIGIGGSYLGPLMATHALKHFAKTDKRIHFLSTPDADLIDELLSTLDASKSLFIISSKSFSTIETITNANTIKKWLHAKVGPDNVAHHLVAVTAHTDKALAYGVLPHRIFPIWEWVGGRYSIWSAISLPLLIQIGSTHFSAFLQGAYDMDQHMLHADYNVNLPILLALIGIWNNNFMGACAHAIIPYAYRLKYLIPYLQQLDMESNGKRINQMGDVIQYKTGPIIFGQEGTEGQHAYHQWLHQSPSWASADILVIDNPYDGQTANIHHHLMKASAFSQAEALMKGRWQDNDDTTSLAGKSRMLDGNRANNLISIESLSPYHLGALIALYEHKITAQGIIWQINSFDQWGVELGKELLPSILTRIVNEQ